ncbi:MAG: DNA polymerase III subunit chi [Gammaproteobacteria bacterium]|nr:MAG: DNA polymerase III subunit chi [Gammaproteobacteria bacterium]
MTGRVDFYLLEEGDPLLLACRLAEKAYEAGLRVYILVSSPEEAKVLDDLLWTFKPNSFLPHALEGDAPILIGTRPPEGEVDVLINLTPSLPPLEKRFPRILEVVDAGGREKARERYRVYKEKGYALHTHKVSVPSRAMLD